MNVLLVAYNFPPDPLVGSLRAAKVASALREAGHRVDVVTARLPAERSDLRTRTDSFAVHTVRSVPHPGRALARLATRRGRRTGGVPGPSRPASGEAASPGGGSRYPSWLRSTAALLWVPDDLSGFVAPAVLRSLRLIRRGVDLVYTTSPPHSSHLVGLMLKRLTGVRWVMELRDPWREAPNRLIEASRPARAMNRWLERRCLRAADHIIAVSEGIAGIVADRIANDDIPPPIMIRNGIDELAPMPPEPEPDLPFRIRYLGRLGMDRDPLPFLRAVANLRKRHGFGPAELSVEFIGIGDTFRGGSVPAAIDALGIADIARVLPTIPHHEAQIAMREADLLLLLAHRRPAQVPNKLYEYLGSRRPILAITDEDGEVTRLLHEVGGHFIVTNETDGSIERALESALRRSLPSPPSEAVLENLTTRRQMEKLLRELGVDR